MIHRLDSFHRRIARILTGRAPFYLQDEGHWVYPPMGNAMQEAGFYTMSEYISGRQNYLVDYVTTSPILKLCQDAIRPERMKRQLFWWDQTPKLKRKPPDQVDSFHSRRRA
jgi:hypothetical protein